MFKQGIFLLLLFFQFSLLAQEKNMLEVISGSAAFKSDAPLEMIEASSDELKGLLDPSNGNFAFSINTKSFVGFNNPTQQEHFYENYLETTDFPTASYSGKIIEDFDLSKDGIFEIRAKGKLKIHGISKERIIKCKLKVEKGKVEFESLFTVRLEDHQITIPKIVNQKIAEEIIVVIKGEMTPKKS
jgi:hypothetical protein